MANAEALADIAAGVKANSTVLGRIEENVGNVAEAVDGVTTSVKKCTGQIGVLVDILKKNPQLITRMTGEAVSMFNDIKKAATSISMTLNAGVTRAEKALAAKTAAASAQKSVDQANKARFAKTITMVASDLERFVKIAVENGYSEAAEFDLEDKTKHQEYAKKICAHSDKLSEVLTNIRIAYNQEVNDRRTDNHTEERMVEPAEIPEPKKKPATKKRTTRKPRKKAAPEPPAEESQAVEEVVDNEEKKAGDEVVENDDVKAKVEPETQEVETEAEPETQEVEEAKEAKEAKTEEKKPKKTTKKPKTEKKTKTKAKTKETKKSRR